MEKPGEHCINQVAQVHITSAKCGFPDTPWRKMYLTSVVFLSNPYPESSHEENIRQTPDEGQPVKHLVANMPRDD